MILTMHVTYVDIQLACLNHEGCQELKLLQRDGCTSCMHALMLKTAVLTPYVIGWESG